MDQTEEKRLEKNLSIGGKISQAAILDAEGTNIMSMTKEELLALFT